MVPIDTDYMHYIIYLAVGLGGGLIVGLIGAGSSLVILPILCVLFHHMYPSTLVIKIAAATTLATITVTATSAAWNQRRYVKLNRRVLMILMSVYILGAYAGANLGHLFPVSWLHYYIGLMLIALSLKHFFVKSSATKICPPPSTTEIALVGFVISVLCSMAGIASGVLMIPYLTRFLEHKIAKATSVASAIAFSLLGTIGYIISGWTLTRNHPSLIGYVNWIVFVAISLGTVPGTALGVRVSNHIDVKMLKQVFYIFLILASVYIMFGMQSH